MRNKYYYNLRIIIYKFSKIYKHKNVIEVLFSTIFLNNIMIYVKRLIN